MAPTERSRARRVEMMRRLRVLDADMPGRIQPRYRVVGRRANRVGGRVEWAENTWTNDQEKARNWRMPLADFYKLLELVKDQPGMRRNVRMARRMGQEPVTASMRLSATLMWLRGASYMDASEKNGIRESTGYEAYHATVNAILAVLPPLELDLQDTARLQEIADGFASRAGLASDIITGCIGPWDGLNQAIRKPSKRDVPNPRDFFCRKGFNALNVQACCDAQLRFTGAHIDSPGSEPDGTCWAMSSTARRTEEAQARGDLTDEDGQQKFYWFGDAAYRAMPYFVTPFGNCKFPDTKDAFDYYHSKVRQTIERAFGVLVRRWGILWRDLACSLRNNVRIVAACMKLHNFCITQRLLRDSPPVGAGANGNGDDLPAQLLQYCLGAAGPYGANQRGRRRDRERCPVRQQIPDALADAGYGRGNAYAGRTDRP
jgi:hypothetical protein